ncbi:MAG: ABC-type proline/glycine betaine transport system ATPase subunit [Myxococcota bacterium]|jgi:ABC-type proline/glycine betaine transport system ATPase subunit
MLTPSDRSAAVSQLTPTSMTACEPAERQWSCDRQIALTFQSYALYPHMTVTESMGFPLKLAKRSKVDATASGSGSRYRTCPSSI